MNPTFRNAFAGGYQPDYLQAVARGAVPGAEPFGGFGERVAAGAVLNGLIWPNGALYIPVPAGVQPSIVSTSANDTAAGTGVRSVEVHYLDANLAPQVEVVVMNGVTPVVMTATNVRFIQCMHAFTTGSGLMTAGVITASFAGSTMSQIAVADLRCRSSARMVPAGKYAFVKAALAGATSGTAAAQVHVELTATEMDAHQFTQEGLFFPQGELAFQDNSFGMELPLALRYSPGTIIAMSFTCDKGVTVTGTWFGWLEDM